MQNAAKTILDKRGASSEINMLNKCFDISIVPLSKNRSDCCEKYGLNMPFLTCTSAQSWFQLAPDYTSDEGAVSSYSVDDQELVLLM